MARRTDPAAPVEDGPDEAYLRWRFSWLVRAHLLAPSFPEIGREATRLDGLPIEEQVARMEAFWLSEGCWIGRSGWSTAWTRRGTVLRRLTYNAGAYEMPSMTVKLRPERNH